MLPAACGSDDTEWELVDTLGQRYRYACDSEKCDVTLAGGGDCADGAITGGAVLQACTKADRAIFTLNCRPVACTSDDGCRTSFDVKYTCMHGICQGVDAPALDLSDLQVLCLADTPRTPGCSIVPGDQSRVDLADAACPGDDPFRTCPTIPAECRQR